MSEISLAIPAFQAPLFSLFKPAILAFYPRHSLFSSPPFPLFKPVIPAKAGIQRPANAVGAAHAHYRPDIGVLR